MMPVKARTRYPLEAIDRQMRNGRPSVEFAENFNPGAISNNLLYSLSHPHASQECQGKCCCLPVHINGKSSIAADTLRSPAHSQKCNRVLLSSVYWTYWALQAKNSSLDRACIGGGDQKETLWDGRELGETANVLDPQVQRCLQAAFILLNRTDCQYHTMHGSDSPLRRGFAA